MKILKVVVLGGLSLILAGVIILFERNNWPAGSSLSGIAVGFSLPAFGNLYKISQTPQIGKPLRES